MNIKSLFTFILLISLAGCFHSKKTPIDPSHIKIDDDIYLKPLGENEEGCSEFSPYSLSGKVVAHVIYYLDQDGNSTTNPNPKNCK